MTVTVLPDPDWQSRALCAEIGRDLFFPATGITARSARKVCAACRVRAECLEWALSFEPGEDEHGVFGGLTAPERAVLRRQRRQAGGQEAA